MGATALFVGAGASAARGYPVTNQLLPLMKEGLEVGSLFGREDGKTSQLGKYLSEFLPGFVTVRAEHLPLITDILSLIDYALLTGNAPAKGATDQELRRFRTLLEEALIWVLKPVPEASLSASRLAQWLHSLSQPLGIITTNYDNSLESVLLPGREDRVDEELDLGFS